MGWQIEQEWQEKQKKRAMDLMGAGYEKEEEKVDDGQCAPEPTHCFADSQISAHLHSQVSLSRVSYASSPSSTQ